MTFQGQGQPSGERSQGQWSSGMKHLLEVGTNVYINNPGHKTKMAAITICGKPLQ